MTGATPKRLRARERGFVLIASLLLLIVVTILALNMFRSFGVQEKIAGNVREKQRALQVAESAQQYAEYWLLNYEVSNASTNGLVQYTTATCSGLTAVGQSPQICGNGLATSTNAGNTETVPWMVGTSELGFVYNSANNALTQSTTPGASTFYGLPRFYISYLGQGPDGNGSAIYQIDSWAYGSSTNTVSEVESVYEVELTAACASC